jgi:hypothetical protein
MNITFLIVQAALTSTLLLTPIPPNHTAVFHPTITAHTITLADDTNTSLRHSGSEYNDAQPLSGSEYND